MNKKIKELSICGFNSVWALYEKHPERIKRLYFGKDYAKSVGDICKYLAGSKKIYRLVEDDELKKIADSVHHGGVIAVINEPELPYVDEKIFLGWVKEKKPLLVLDGVGNAHNLGAIIRSAAFFGFSEVVIPDGATQARPTASTYRVAEGGMESVNVYLVEDLPYFLDKICRDYHIIGTSSRGNAVLNSSLKINTGGKKIALVLGNEETGLPGETEKKCAILLKIPGSYNVESLNVTAAATVFMFYLRNWFN